MKAREIFSRVSCAIMESKGEDGHAPAPTGDAPGVPTPSTVPTLFISGGGPQDGLLAVIKCGTESFVSTAGPSGVYLTVLHPDTTCLRSDCFPTDDVNSPKDFAKTIMALPAGVVVAIAAKGKLLNTYLELPAVEEALVSIGLDKMACGMYGSFAALGVKGESRSSPITATVQRPRYGRRAVLRRPFPILPTNDTLE